MLIATVLCTICPWLYYKLVSGSSDTILINSEINNKKYLLHTTLFVTIIGVFQILEIDDYNIFIIMWVVCENYVVEDTI